MINTKVYHKYFDTPSVSYEHEEAAWGIGVLNGVSQEGFNEILEDRFESDRRWVMEEDEIPREQGWLADERCLEMSKSVSIDGFSFDLRISFSDEHLLGEIENIDESGMNGLHVSFIDGTKCAVGDTEASHEVNRPAADVVKDYVAQGYDYIQKGEHRPIYFLVKQDSFEKIKKEVDAMLTIIGYFPNSRDYKTDEYLRDMCECQEWHHPTDFEHGGEVDFAPEVMEAVIRPMHNKTVVVQKKTWIHKEITARFHVMNNGNEFTVKTDEASVTVTLGTDKCTVKANADKGSIIIVAEILRRARIYKELFV